MKKKVVSEGRMLVIIMTLVSFVFFWQNMQYVYAVEDGREVEEVPPKRLMKKIILKTNETKEMPRYIVEDGGLKKCGVSYSTTWEISDEPVPLAPPTTGGALPFIIWFRVLTAPVYALEKEERYRYIGRIRLKKTDGMYTAYLTKRLLAKAELPIFMIKPPKKVRKKAGDMMIVCCPDGKRILLEIEKEMCFTVEGD